MHMYNAIVLAVMATAAAAAPSAGCHAGYTSVGGGDGFLCYKITCNRDIGLRSNKQIKAKNIQDCLDKCYTSDCWAPSFDAISKTCYFHKQTADDAYPLKKKDDFIAATPADNGQCL